MSDDGGVQWFQTVCQQQEYEAWLDSIEPGIEQAVEDFEAMARPVNAPVKESENGHAKPDDRPYKRN